MSPFAARPLPAPVRPADTKPGTTGSHRHVLLALASVILLGLALTLPTMGNVIDFLGAGSGSVMLWIALPLLAAGTHLLVRANQPAPTQWQVSDLESWNDRFLYIETKLVLSRRLRQLRERRRLTQPSGFAP